MTIYSTDNSIWSSEGGCYDFKCLWGGGVYSYFLIHIIAKDDTSLLDIYNTYATEKIAKQKQ